MLLLIPFLFKKRIFFLLCGIKIRIVSKLQKKIRCVLTKYEVTIYVCNAIPGFSLLERVKCGIQKKNCFVL